MFIKRPEFRLFNSDIRVLIKTNDKSSGHNLPYGVEFPYGLSLPVEPGSPTMTKTYKFITRFAALCLSVLLICGAALASTGKQIALVIGNSNYSHITRLPNTINDAQLIAKTLRKAGFDVVEGLDLDKVKMAATIDQFTERAYNADLAVVYFAGHGMQVDGKNYLMPVDALLSSPAHLQTRAFDVDKIVASLPIDPGVGIVILDACRDNPLARTYAARLPASRSVTVSSGFAAVQTRASGKGTGGILIAYATDPGSVALDGNGINSPYTAALAKHITVPGVSLQSALTRVRGDVTNSTKGQQRPWHNASLGREIFLGGETKVATLSKVPPSSLNDSQPASTLVLVPAPTKAKPAQPENQQSTSTNNNDGENWAVERRFWDEVSKRNSIAHYQAYLKQYPSGQFTTIADINIQSLLQKKIANADNQNSTEENVQVAAVTDEGNSTARTVVVLHQSLRSTLGTIDTEALISLNRNQRTDLQLRLTALGHNTQGADGKIGPNSRKAIGEWQEHTGITASTYLTREQWNHLQQASDPLMAAIYAERERVARTAKTVVKKNRNVRRKVTKRRTTNRKVTRRTSRERQRYEERRYREEQRNRDRDRRRRNNNAAAGLIIGGFAGAIVACKITHSC
jgi:uncharacterized caspase-like protein